MGFTCTLSTDLTGRATSFVCETPLKIYSNLKRVPIIETNTEVKYAK